jgi:hypothetical protein
MLAIAVTWALVLCQNRFISSHEKPAAATNARTKPPPAESAANLTRSEE